MRMIRRIFSLEFLFLPFYTYKLIELFVFKDKTSLPIILLRLSLSSLTLLLIFPTIILFAIFYELVEFYLKYKCGPAFHDMMDGCDRLWIVKTPSRHIINMIHAISPSSSHPTNANLSIELLTFLKQKYALLAKTHPRISSVIKSFLGLQYYYIVDLDIDSCVKYIEEDYSNFDEFCTLIQSYSNKNLPKDDSYLWEVYVGRHKLIWHDGKEICPVLSRYHHSICDAVCFITLMTTHLLDNGVEIMREKCEIYKNITKKHTDQKTRKESLNEKSANSCSNSSVMRFLQKKFYLPTIVYPEKDNLIHGPISGGKHMIFCWEKPGDDFFNKVKKVKNYYQVAFIDIVSTAISAALHEHFSKFSKKTTKNIIAMNPFFLMSPDFNKLIQFNNDDIPIVKLGNKFAIGFSQIPINLNCKDINNGNNEILKIEENELIRRLRCVQKNNNKLKNALDLVFCYWQFEFLLLPLRVAEMIYRANDASLSISNVMGDKTSRLANGCIMTDTFAFGNNYGNLGVSITLFAHDDCFRIGLVIDKSLIPERKDSQLLGDGIFKYIDALVDTLPSETT